MLFPPGTFADHPDLDTETRAWYSRHLAAMDEEALYEKLDQKAEVYRFLKLPTFNNPWPSGSRRTRRPCHLLSKA